MTGWDVALAACAIVGLGAAWGAVVLGVAAALEEILERCSRPRGRRRR